MKKILEVLQYGDNDIRFNTDFNIKSEKDAMDLIGKITFTMLTKLWGGNEQAVIAIIRLLAVSDLALCVNRKEMIKMLARDSESVAQLLKEVKQEMERNGHKVTVFGPGINPPKMRS